MISGRGDRSWKGRIDFRNGGAEFTHCSCAFFISCLDARSLRFAFQSSCYVLMLTSWRVAGLKRACCAVLCDVMRQVVSHGVQAYQNEAT